MYRYQIGIIRIIIIYVANWYHKYLLCLIIDRIQVIIFKHLYYSSIRNFVWLKVAFCNSFHHTKDSTTTKEVNFQLSYLEKNMEYIVCMFNRPIEILPNERTSLILETITSNYPVSMWFEMTKYDHKKAMTITNLFKTTWLTWYPCPKNNFVTIDHNSLVATFKNTLIGQLYGIKDKLATLGNSQGKYKTKIVHNVLVNIIRMLNKKHYYEDEDDPRRVILAAP